LSSFGTALTHFSLVLWITTRLYAAPEASDQLALALVAYSLAYDIPGLVLGPVAGAWADRHDRRWTMVAMDFANGCLSIGLVLLLAQERLGLASLLLIGLLNAAFNVFHVSAFETTYAVLVPSEKLARANGMMSTVNSISWILAPGAAAALISAPRLAREGRLPIFTDMLAGVSDGTVLAAGLDAATFLLASATLVLLVVPSPSRMTDLYGQDGRRMSLRSDIAQGVSYVFTRRPLLYLAGTVAVVNLLSGVFPLLPLLVRSRLGSGWHTHGYTVETALAFLTSVGALGGLLSGLIIVTWGGLKRSRVHGSLLPGVALGVAAIGIGASPWFYLTAALLLVTDAMIPIMNSHTDAIWQASTPHELQGRVFAVRRLMGQASNPISVVVCGLLVTVLGPGGIFLTFGALVTAWCTGMLFNPWLTRLDDGARAERAVTPGEPAPEK
jgi:MFS family permease